MFLINFFDFNCPLCYDDFLNIVEWSKMRDSASLSKIFIFKTNATKADSMETERINMWANVNNINYPIKFVLESFFKRNNILKSVILVLNEENELYYEGYLPFGEEGRKEIKNYLSPNK